MKDEVDQLQADELILQLLRRPCNNEATDSLQSLALGKEGRVTKLFLRAWQIGFDKGG